MSSSPAFFANVFAQFESDCCESERQLRNALNLKDYGAIKDTAHAIRGVAASIGAFRLAAMAVRIGKYVYS